MQEKCYIVTYDLRKVKDYSNLIAAIKSYGTWAYVLKSVWAVVTTSSAVQVRNHLLQHMDGDDGIFVVLSGKEAAWQKVECTDDWLKKQL